MEARNSKMEAVAHSPSGKSLLPGSQTAVFLLRPHIGGRVRELSVVSFLGTLILFLRLA